MERLRSVLLSLVICLLLCGPGLIMALTVPLSLDLPSWLTAEDSTYLSGGIQKADLKKNTSVAGFAQKKFQSSLETAVGNYIPAKASCLLGNSAIQRTFIDISASLLGVDCATTFYGSDIVYSKQYNALSKLPKEFESDQPSKLKHLAEELNKAAEKHPDVRFVVYLTDAAYSSESNVAKDLVSYKQITTSAALEVLRGNVNAPNLKVLGDPISDTHEYFEDYYRSDHHWTMRGAMRAYDSICRELDLKGIEDPSFKDIDGPAFYGSSARAGLIQLSDTPIDINYDFSSVEYQDGKEWFSGNDHHGYFDAALLDKEYKFYNLYWKREGNLHGPGSTNAVLVSDSFGDCLRRPLALNHAKLSPKLNLHENEGGEGVLADYIRNNDADTVYFIGGLSNFLSFEKRNPQFFD